MRVRTGCLGLQTASVAILRGERLPREGGELCSRWADGWSLKEGRNHHLLDSGLIFLSFGSARGTGDTVWKGLGS